MCSQCSGFQGKRMPLYWLGGPEQCEFQHAHQPTETFTPEGVLEGPRKLFHLVCMFAWRCKWFKTVYWCLVDVLIMRCSGSRYKTFRPCITGMRAVSVFLAVGELCCSLGSKKLWQAGFCLWFSWKKRSQEVDSLVTSELDPCLFADDAILFSSLNLELQQTLGHYVQNLMMCVQLLIIKSLEKV